MKTFLRHWPLALAFAACIPAALAHDTWLSPAPGPQASGLLRLELGFGNHYPVRLGGTAASGVRQAGCVAPGDQRIQPLLPRQERPEALEMRARIDDAQGAACWVELKPYDVELTPELVTVYLDEIRAPAAHRERAAAQRAKGIVWRESYRKFIRIELGARAPAPGEADLGSLRKPQGLGLEIVPIGSQAIRVGQPTSFQVLLEGQPIAGLAVQLVSERSPLGIWRETDAQGRIQQALPFGGQWLLRATRLEPPDSDAQPWHSRFATLVIHAS